MLQQDRLPVQVTILQQVAVQVPVLAITVALRAARVLVTAGHPVVQVPVLVIVVDQPIVLLPEVHIAQAHHLPAAVHPEVEEAVAGEAEADADKKAR